MKAEITRTPFEWIDSVALRLWQRYMNATDSETRSAAGIAYVFAADARDLVTLELETSSRDFERQCARCEGKNGAHVPDCQEVTR